MGPLAAVGIKGVELELTLHADFVKLAARGTLALNSGKCQGIFECFLADIPTPTLAPSATFFMTGDYTVESLVQTPAVILKPGKLSFEDIKGGGPGVFTDTYKKGLLFGGRQGVRLPLKMCVEKCSSDVPTNIYFSGEIAVNMNAVSQMLEGTLTMTGWWKNALGMPFLHFDLLKLTIGFELKTWPPLPLKLEVATTLCLGSWDACGPSAETLSLLQEHEFVESETEERLESESRDTATVSKTMVPSGEFIRGGAFIGFNAMAPEENYMMGMVSTMTVDSIFGVLGDTLNDKFLTWRAGLPGPVARSGIYPLRPACEEGKSGSDCCTTEQQKNPTLVQCFARFSYSPLASQSVVTSYGTIVIPQGITVSGRLNLLDWKLAVDIQISKLSLKVDAVMDPINLAGIVKLGRSLTDFKQGPRFYMYFQAMPPMAAVQIAGAYSIPPLLTSGAVAITLGKEGFSMETESTILGIAKSCFSMAWQWDFSHFHVTGNFSKGGAAEAKEKIFKNMIGLLVKAVEVAEAACTLLQETLSKPISDASDQIISYVKQVDKACDAVGSLPGVKQACQAVTNAAKKPLTAMVNLAEKAIQGLLSAIKKLPGAMLSTMGLDLDTLKKMAAVASFPTEDELITRNKYTNQILIQAAAGDEEKFHEVMARIVEEDKAKMGLQKEEEEGPDQGFDVLIQRMSRASLSRQGRLEADLSNTEPLEVWSHVVPQLVQEGTHEGVLEMGTTILDVSFFGYSLTLDGGNMQASVEIKATVMGNKADYKFMVKLDLAAVVKWIFDKAMGAFKDMKETVTKQATQLYDAAIKTVTAAIDECKKVIDAAKEAVNKAVDAAKAAAEKAAKAAEKAAKAVKEKAEKVAENTAKAKETAEKAAEKAAKATEKAAKAAKETAEKAAEKTAKATEKASKAAKETAEKAAEKTAKATEKAAKAVKEKAEKAAENTTKAAERGAKATAKATADAAKKAADAAKNLFTGGRRRKKVFRL